MTAVFVIPSLKFRALELMSVSIFVAVGVLLESCYDRLASYTQNSDIVEK